MINHLTDEQTKLLEEYFKQGVEIGLSTENIEDSEEIKKIIYDLYTVILNKPTPDSIETFDSPKQVWRHICEVTGIKMSFVWSYLSGSFDSYIFSYYDYMFKIGVTVSNDLKNKYDIWRRTQKLGLIYPFDDVCILCKKPETIKLNENGLHNEKGPALVYPDGWCIWSLNGVRMPSEYVTTPWNKLDPNLILKENNAEIRRELVRKIGIERIVDKLDAKIIDKEGEYELLTLNLGDNRVRPYLKMKNPSIGVYHIEGIRPGVKTVKEALEFRNGTKEKPDFLS